MRRSPLRPRAEDLFVELGDDDFLADDDETSEPPPFSLDTCPPMLDVHKVCGPTRRKVSPPVDSTEAQKKNADKHTKELENYFGSMLSCFVLHGDPQACMGCMSDKVCGLDSDLDSDDDANGGNDERRGRTTIVKERQRRRR